MCCVSIMTYCICTNFFCCQNFVGNSFNVRDRNILGQLWEAFSEATKKVSCLININTMSSNTTACDNITNPFIL